MRLTKKDGTLKLESVTDDKWNKAIEKLGRLEDIEEELGFELPYLFDLEYDDDNYFIQAKEDGDVYFCGDAYYGTYTPDRFLCLLRELLSAYRKAKKVKEENK